MTYHEIPTQEELESAVIAVIARRLRINPEEIKASSDLRRDLRMNDSIIHEVCMEMREKHRTSGFSSADVAMLDTPGGIAIRLRAKLQSVYISQYSIPEQPVSGSDGFKRYTQFA